MILSILIPSTFDRADMLSELVSELTRQINELGRQGDVEIKTAVDGRQMSTGNKRNLLVNSAIGIWQTFIDSDDEVSPVYVEEILKGAESDCDCMAMSGIMTTDGNDMIPWDISMHNEYKALFKEDGSVLKYVRFINHLSPVKSEIAKKIPFPDLYYGEDFHYAVRLKDSGLLKNEYRIPEPIMYHYKFVNK